MQIFVKTLTFGTIILKVQGSDTIEELQKKLRLHLDRMCDGFDVELVVEREGAHGYEYKGKQLEAGKTLSDYNIQEESTIHMVSGLGGQGKRARGSGDNDDEATGKKSSDLIVEVLGNFSAEASDCEAVKSFLNAEKLDIEKWLTGLDSKQLLNLKTLMASRDRSGLNDVNIKAFAKFHGLPLIKWRKPPAAGPPDVEIGARFSLVLAVLAFFL